MAKKHYVRIRPGLVDNGRQELLRILEDVLPVKCLRESNERASFCRDLVLENLKTEPEAKCNSQTASLTIPAEQPLETGTAFAEINVRFADDADVPFPFRGRIVTSKARGSTTYLRCRRDEKVLASDDRGCLWVVSTGGRPKQYRSAFALPPLPPGRMFQEVFNGDRFIELLPVIHFLREVGRSESLEGPPLRACFIFDDPNLHWPRYGLVDFQQIAARAAEEGYHVSFATIPLDAWFTHKSTAELFRKNAKYLSLCVHGNNHTREELAGNYSQSARVSLLNQAIRRVERLERNARIRVCRVMVPPHGACSEEMLAELPRCGFEAACISHGSLLAYNPSKRWTRQLGLSPSEIIAGCPVLPRWAITGNARNTILVAAYLRQPIILRGHHQDLKDGVELLDQLAGFINGLGPVLWSNLTDLIRINYLWRMDGQVLTLRPLGPKLNVRVPEQATKLILEDAFNTRANANRRIISGEIILSAILGEEIELPENVQGEFSIETLVEPSSTANGSRGLGPRALVRRILTEGRDRFLPVS
jgi:hypothetical protein